MRDFLPVKEDAVLLAFPRDDAARPRRLAPAGAPTANTSIQDSMLLGCGFGLLSQTML